MRLRTSLFAAALILFASTLRAQTPVIIDTDIGDDIDDVFAVGLALSSPEMKLLGITSAWGDTALRARMIDRLLCETGLTPSRGAARRLIDQGGAYVNGEQITDVEALVRTDAVDDGAVMLRYGKKKFHRVIVE